MNIRERLEEEISDLEFEVSLTRRLYDRYPYCSVMQNFRLGNLKAKRRELAERERNAQRDGYAFEKDRFDKYIRILKRDSVFFRHWEYGRDLFNLTCAEQKFINYLVYKAFIYGKFDSVKLRNKELIYCLDYRHGTVILQTRKQCVKKGFIEFNSKGKTFPIEYVLKNKLPFDSLLQEFERLFGKCSCHEVEL